MTYDASRPERPGFNAPLPWVENNVRLLVDADHAVEQRAKVDKLDEEPEPCAFICFHLFAEAGCCVPCGNIASVKVHRLHMVYPGSNKPGSRPAVHHAVSPVNNNCTQSDVMNRASGIAARGRPWLACIVLLFSVISLAAVL